MSAPISRSEDRRVVVRVNQEIEVGCARRHAPAPGSAGVLLQRLGADGRLDDVAQHAWLAPDGSLTIGVPTVQRCSALGVWEASEPAGSRLPDDDALGWRPPINCALARQIQDGGRTTPVGPARRNESPDAARRSRRNAA